MRECIYRYDVTKYDMRYIVAQLYTPSLESLHYQLETDKVKGVGKDSDTVHHKVFYDKLRSGWLELEYVYKRFIYFEVLPIIGCDKVVYQKYPTYRLHYPNNKAVSDFHCDGQDGYNHPKGEINFMLPLTESKDSSALWTESEPGKKDFNPANMRYGQFLMFNGNECVHGNKENQTDKTRVSFDFRVIPWKDYNDSHTGTTATKGMKFTLGEYYAIMNK